MLLTFDDEETTDIGITPNTSPNLIGVGKATVSCTEGAFYYTGAHRPVTAFTAVIGSGFDSRHPDKKPKLVRDAHIPNPRLFYFFASKTVCTPQQMRYTATISEPAKSSQWDTDEAGATSTESSAAVTQPSTILLAR